jgi:glycosyltransferase involved in cell wall biosynthesis
MGTVSLCLITKNEAHNLPRCLASVQGYVYTLFVPAS